MDGDPITRQGVTDATFDKHITIYQIYGKVTLVLIEIGASYAPTWTPCISITFALGDVHA
jgi:hypothetical protein